MLRYDIKKGVKKFKTKTALSLSVVVLGLAGIGLALAFSHGSARADSNTINFESYTLGNINGQDGWTALGSAGSGCAVYDEVVAPNPGTTYNYPSFGTKSFRISDAATSGCFGDQAFAKPLIDSAGETGSTAGTFSVGTKQPHFEMQFDIASTMSTQQTGMHVSVSPDRGDGSRMSYLRFDDSTIGINVFFDDVQQSAPCTPAGCANFVETRVGTNLSRTVPHTIKLTIDFFDGPGNDVVKVYIDGSLVHTGTSWEDYYRYDPEAVAEPTPRIVKTVLFRESGVADPGNAGNGFLIDNLSLLSGPIPTSGPTTKDQCKNNGWTTFSNPTFKNQGLCVSWVEHNVLGHGNGH